MRNMFSGLIYKLRIFMQGRYGVDELSKVLIYVSLALMIISVFPFLKIFYLLAVLLLIFTYFRCFSKNITARINERNKYYEIKNKYFDIYIKMFKDKKTHRYFKCKRCKQYTRVPVGLGKVEITCRVCKSKMTKKS